MLFFIVRYYGQQEGYAPGAGPEYRPGADQSQEAASPLPSTDLERISPYDVNVEIERRSSHGSGTAFLVNANGRWLTARHVVQGCSSVYLQVAPRRGMAVKRVQENTRADMAVLITQAVNVAVVQYAADMPNRGDVGFMTGYPQGNPGDVYGQMIGSKRMQTSGQYRVRERVLVWAERQRRPNYNGSLGGLSGGPVFDRDGGVIGIAVAESQRRGRIFTAHPDVLHDPQLADAGDGKGTSKGVYPFGNDDFDNVGSQLRRQLTVAKVVCVKR